MEDDTICGLLMSITTLNRWGKVEGLVRLGVRRSTEDHPVRFLGLVALIYRRE